MAIDPIDAAKLKVLYQYLPDIDKLSKATCIPASELWELLGAKPPVETPKEPDPELLAKLEDAQRQAERASKAAHHVRVKRQELLEIAKELDESVTENDLEPSSFVLQREKQELDSLARSVHDITRYTIQSALTLVQKVQRKLDQLGDQELTSQNLTSLVTALSLLIDKVQTLRGLPKGYSASVQYLDPDDRKARIAQLKRVQ